MKIKILLILIVSLILCFCTVYAQRNYKVLLNPENPDVNIVCDEHTLFILDYSNSMNEMLVDRTKYEMLLGSMKMILSKMSPENKIGLRVYGQRWGFTPMDACRASCLAVPVGAGENNYYEISQALTKYKPRGMTPITYSLKQAVQKDLKGLEGEKHIILITDGGENCDESPCEYAMELVKYRKDIRIDVIALNIDNYDDLEQLICTAKVTRGKLYKADTKAELIHSLNNAFKSKKSVDAKILY